MHGKKGPKAIGTPGQKLEEAVHSWVLVIFFSESSANIRGAVIDGDQKENPGQGHYLHFFPFKQQLTRANCYRKVREQVLILIQ